MIASKVVSNALLFDWGNTLMMDFGHEQGKMKDWPCVEACPFALETLQILAKRYPIYIATSAQDSNESEIREAFKRVGLDVFISGYFCYDNLGLSKGTKPFYQAIAKKLDCAPHTLTMIGDNYEKDIASALESGLNAIWLNHSGSRGVKYVDSISSLNELPELLQKWVS
jgi:putative hydrolase of the HAD superfamily